MATYTITCVDIYLKRIRILSLSVLMFFMTAQGYGQQNPHSSMGHLETYLLNPALGGMENRLSVTAMYRMQWQGLPGSPESIWLNAHLPFYSIGGAGGMQLANQRIGADADLKASLTYNQVFGFRSGLLSMGLRAGFVRKTIDGLSLV